MREHNAPPRYTLESAQRPEWSDFKRRIIAELKSCNYELLECIQSHNAKESLLKFYDAFTECSIIEYITPDGNTYTLFAKGGEETPDNIDEVSAYYNWWDMQADRRATVREVWQFSPVY